MSERMLTVQLLEQGIAVLEALGYQIRTETELGRSLVCRVKGRPWLVLDPTQNPRDQLDTVLAALADEQQRNHITLPEELSRVLPVWQRHAA